MDEMTLLHEFRSDDAQPSTTAELRARRLLLAAAIEPRAHRSGLVVRRTAWSVAAVVGLFAFTVVGVPQLGSDDQRAPAGVDSAAALVSVTRSADSYTVVIGDIGGDVAPVNAELRRRGINARFGFEVASPSGVGKVLTQSFSSNAAAAQVRVYYRASAKSASDAVSVTIPVLAPSEQVGFEIGRRAAPGEVYNATANSAEEPGEVLHCHFITNTQVGQAATALHELGVTARWRKQGGPATATPPDADAWVFQVMPYSDGVVEVYTSPERPPSTTEAELVKVREDC